MNWLFWLLLFPTAHAEVTVRFQDLPSIVGKQNDRVGAADLETSAARKREGALIRSYLPKLNAWYGSESFAQGSRDRLTQPNYGAELSVSLFNGFRDSLENEARANTTRTLEAEQRITISEELEKARNAFWTVVALEGTNSLLKGAQKTNENNQKAAERRMRSGVATETDRIEFEMRGVNLSRELGANEVRLAQKRRELALALGYPSSTPVTVQDALEHQHDWQTELKHSETEHEFQVEALKSDQRSAELRSEYERRRPLPEIEAFAGLYQFDEREREKPFSDDRRESVFGIRLKMSLGDFWNANNERQAANIQAESKQRLISQRRKEIESHIESEMSELSFLHSQVHSADENTKRADRYYTLTQSEYTRGVKNSVDVVAASDRLLEAQIKRLELLRDFQIARSHILSKLGR